jgi:hypothetical protein
MNPNKPEDLSMFDEYKLYPKEKYEQLLKPDEITNLTLDEFVIIDGMFKMCQIVTI